jgi:hypothetical protein
MQPAVGGDGGVPKFRLEMARHQERVAQSSAGHVGCPDGTRAAERPHRAHCCRSDERHRLFKAVVRGPAANGRVGFCCPTDGRQWHNCASSGRSWVQVESCACSR